MLLTLSNLVALSAATVTHPAEADGDAPPIADADGEDAAPRSPPTSAMPAKVDICITSAVIAPTKGDGSPWDAGGSEVSHDEQKAVDAALKAAIKVAGSNPAGIAVAIASIFARPGLQAVAKPDVFGTVELAVKGSYGGNTAQKLSLASSKKPVREFQPNFGITACFSDVAWSDEVRLRVDLSDKDIANDDKIATVEALSAEHR